MNNAEISNQVDKITETPYAVAITSQRHKEKVLTVFIVRFVLKLSELLIQLDFDF